MIYAIKRVLSVIVCWFLVQGSLLAEEKKPLNTINRGDTLLVQTFSSKSDFSLFIAEELKITESVSTLNEQEVDSLHQLLNSNKQVLISKADLVKFLDFSVIAPETELVLGQAVELSAKSRVLRLELDANQGDSFALNYVVEKGIGSAAHIEVLLNQVRVTKALSVNRGKKVNLDFVANEAGLVEIVFRNVGPFDEKGFIEVYATPRTEQVEVKKIRTPKIKKELVDAIVTDTLFQTVVEEQVVLSHRANLKGKPAIQKQLELGTENELLGFAVFFFPYKEKDKLQISRREVYREDPLEDFSKKELIGKSFTYLPEFNFPDLVVSFLDSQKKMIWSNGSFPSPDNWRVGPNSKANYAFIQPKQKVFGGNVQVRLSNTSELYELDFGLKIISLTVKNFIVKQEVDVEEFEETILLTLL